MIFPRPYGWGICKNTDIALKPVMHRFSLDILCVVLGFSKDPPCHFPFGKNDTELTLSLTLWLGDCGGFSKKYAAKTEDSTSNPLTSLKLQYGAT